MLPHGEVKERREQARRGSYARPELLATRPNELWSWDITKLRGPGKGTCFSLDVVLDVVSRYVVGWMLAPQETGALAKKLFRETCARQGVPCDQLTVHADRGSSMTSKPLVRLLADLRVTQTHSRPRVSNDNPYSESQFKTLTYRPDYPDRFASLEEARAWCAKFFDWYNREHFHAGLALLTPCDVHHGRGEARRAQRATARAAAYAAQTRPTHARAIVVSARRPPPPSLARSQDKTTDPGLSNGLRV